MTSVAESSSRQSAPYSRSKKVKGLEKEMRHFYLKGLGVRVDLGNSWLQHLILGNVLLKLEHKIL